MLMPLNATRSASDYKPIPLMVFLESNVSFSSIGLWMVMSWVGGRRTPHNPFPFRESSRNLLKSQLFFSYLNTCSSSAFIFSATSLKSDGTFSLNSASKAPRNRPQLLLNTSTAWLSYSSSVVIAVLR